MVEKEKEDIVLKSALIPSGLVHMSFGFVFGKWNIWAQINGYWYRGTHADVNEAYTLLLESAAKGAHISKVVNPLDGRTKEAKALKQQEEVNFKEDF
jgi:hypothetical protein